VIDVIGVDGTISKYPAPELRLPAVPTKVLLDILI
jgi:hypothetical protein